MQAVLGCSICTSTAPSRITASATGWVAICADALGKHFTKSAFCPPLSCPRCKSDGGHGWFSYLKKSFKFPSWIDTLFHRQRQSTAGDVDWETVTCCRSVDALQIQRATVAFKTISCWCEPPVVSCLIFLETILFDSGNALMDHWPSISPLLLPPSFFMCLFNASLKRSFFHRVFSLQSWILHKTHIWGFCCQTYDTHDRLIEQSCFRHIYFHAKVASGTGEPVCNFLDDSRICCNKGRIIGKE